MDSNCKVYARQIPYEWQESPWDLWGAEQMITDKAPYMATSSCKDTLSMSSTRY